MARTPSTPATPKKKRVSTVDPNETKADKFVRLAKARTTKALKALKQLENLGGSNYDYSAAQVKQIISALDQGVARVETKLSKTIEKAEVAFGFAEETKTAVEA